MPLRSVNWCFAVRFTLTLFMKRETRPRGKQGMRVVPEGIYYIIQWFSQKSEKNRLNKKKQLLCTQSPCSPNLTSPANTPSCSISVE